MKKIIIFLALLLIFTFSSCSLTYENEYKEDIKISIPNQENFIVIKEWNLLLSGGADIYYETNDGIQTLLGTTDGTDDGYTPFTNGEYTIEFKDNEITLSYDYGNLENTIKTNTFKLP